MTLYFSRFVLFCADAVNDFMYKNCPYVAGAIAFYTMFSLFPLFLGVVSILGFALGPEAEQSDLVQQIADVVPISKEFIKNTLGDVVNARAITGVFGILGVIWASTAAFGAIRKGINNAWGIRKTRPFLRERFMDLSLVIGGGTLVVVLLFITPVFSLMKEFTSLIAPNSFLQNGILWDLATNLVSPIISFIIFTLIYYFIPNTQIRIQNVWPTALGVAIAFWIENAVFVWWVQTFPIHNAVYGPVGAILALLTWVYISATILLFGALLCSRYSSYTKSYESISTVNKTGLKLVLSSVTRVRLRNIKDPSALFTI
jgi:membrane protein